MKRRYLAISVLMICSVVRAEITDGLVLEGGQKIFDVLVSPHPEFENPQCLSDALREDKIADLRVMTGHRLTSIAFHKRTERLGKHLYNVMHVDAVYKAPPEHLPVLFDFNCILANQ